MLRSHAKILLHQPFPFICSCVHSFFHSFIHFHFFSLQLAYCFLRTLMTFLLTKQNIPWDPYPPDCCQLCLSVYVQTSPEEPSSVSRPAFPYSHSLPTPSILASGHHPQSLHRPHTPQCLLVFSC
jgi:hypothetical protein